MTGIEISLLLIGSIFMIGSFFISEKLSASELNKIAELSADELKKIIDKGMNQAGLKIDDLIDAKMDVAADKTEIVMERESNLKIMAIHEYSDTVFESMKKTHDEIMFLYSMLNDKHSEMTSLTGELQRLAADVRNLQENYQIREDYVRKTLPKEPAPAVFESLDVGEPVLSEPNLSAEEQDSTQEESKQEKALLENNNNKILSLYQEGFSKVDIARKLGLGIGEVNLVIELYKGETNQ